MTHQEMQGSTARKCMTHKTGLFWRR